MINCERVSTVDVMHIIDRLRKDIHSTPEIKPWRGKKFEVYFKKDNRLFFCTIKDVIYLLYACKKQKNKTEKKDSEQIKKSEVIS